MAKVEFRSVTKSFGHVAVVHGIDMNVADREFIVIVGPSGCGKSTVLRMVAGLEAVSGGEIVIGDRVVNDLEPKDRDIAMVFQNYALYPHMSVYDNMAYGLKIRGMAKLEIEECVKRAAGILELGALLERKPRELSGGQRQRVAMGRAIVREPAVFLFDEPLSNLDAKLRVQMRFEIQKLHQRLGTTTLYVTHDQVEAMTLAQRMVVMNAGRAEQIGTPMDVYEDPATQFVAGFIGSPSMNFLAGRSEGGGRIALERHGRSRPRGHGRHPARTCHSRQRDRWTLLGDGRTGRASRRRHARPPVARQGSCLRPDAARQQTRGGLDAARRCRSRSHLPLRRRHGRPDALT
jgi:sn-glycerol 3-phosphate transport system ATP-binding protein